MTLLEILVRELPKRGGWPAQFKVAHTDGGRLKIVFESSAFMPWGAPWSENMDIEPGIVTREQYEAALSAVEPEWNGEGLPPVGCECEAKYGSPTSEWFYFKCLSVDCGVAFGWAGKEPVVLRGSVYEFRPIRSEADRKRDETLAALESCLVAAYADDSERNTEHYLYSAIEAGQIPHLKIV